MESTDESNAGTNTKATDSWIDAFVTLLATVVFGLGWVLVELERADPPPNGYDAAVSTAWVAAVARSIEIASTLPVEASEGGDERWTERSPQSSNP